MGFFLSFLKDRLYIMIILLVFIAIIGTSIYLSRKYNNPYKLYFLFGKKGSGKSLYMVKLMLYYLRKGWNVYTDMPGCLIPNVRTINSDDLATFTPIENSVIFLDEVGISMSNRDFKSMPKAKIEWFKFQRKYKCLVYMNSQSYDIDKKIRDLVDGMFLCSNLFNCLEIIRPINRSITLTEPTADSESRIADVLKFAPIWNWIFFWMPNYYKYFSSFNAPERIEIPFTSYKAEVKDLLSKSPKKSIKHIEKDIEINDLF